MCDTTSRLYGLGKGLSLKRFTSSSLFRDKAEEFCKKDATVDDIIDAVEAALVRLYHIRPQTLPPTSAAAIYHNMRVYLQIQQWLVVCNMMKTDWVDDKGRERRPCYDVTSSSTRRAAPCHQMQLHN